MTIEEIIRQLQKLDSKLLAGQVIYAHRDVGSLIAYFEKMRRTMIKEYKQEQEGDDEK